MSLIAARRALISRRTSAPSWVLRGADGVPALMDFDFENGRALYNGRAYASIAPALAEAGGTKSSNAYAFGPYLDPAGVNYISNGDFPANTTGWSPFNATIASVGGELEMTGSGGANACATQQVTGWEGQGGLMTATGRRGTSGETFNLCASAVNAALGGSGILSNNVASTSPVAVSAYIGGTAGLWIGPRSQAGATGGTSLWDDIRLVKASPVKGWIGTAGTSGFIDFITPPTMSATEVVEHFGAGVAENFRVRLEISSAYAATIDVRLANSAQASLSLGTLSPSTRYRVAFSLAASAFHASLNGGAAVSDTSGGWVGATHLWFGRGASGNTFNGTLNRAAVLNGAQGKTWAEATSASPFDAMWAEGDSGMAGANGIGFAASVRDLDRVAIVTAAGGSTLAGARDRIAANIGVLKGLPLVVADWSANSYGSVAATLAIVDQILALHPRVLWVASVNLGSTVDGSVDAYTLDMEAIRDGVAARGVTVIDPAAIAAGIIAAQGGSATAEDLLAVQARIIPPSLKQDDTIHPSQLMADAVAADIDAALVALGWWAA